LRINALESRPCAGFFLPALRAPALLLRGGATDAPRALKKQ